MLLQHLFDVYCDVEHASAPSHRVRSGSGISSREQTVDHQIFYKLKSYKWSNNLHDDTSEVQEDIKQLISCFSCSDVTLVSVTQSQPAPGFSAGLLLSRWGF